MGKKGLGKPLTQRLAHFVGVVGLGSKLVPVDVDADERYDPIIDVAVYLPSKETCPDDFTPISRTVTGREANVNHGSFFGKDMFIAVKRAVWRSGDMASSVVTSRSDPHGDGTASVYTLVTEVDSRFGNYMDTIDPIVDLTVVARNQVPPGWTPVTKTVSGNSADLNAGSGGSHLTLAYKRASSESGETQRGPVVDVCIIFTDKNEVPPPNYTRVDCNLNKHSFGSDIFLCFKNAPPRGVMDSRYQASLIDWGVPMDSDVHEPPQFLPLFSFPRGIRIKEADLTAPAKPPKFITFVLTNEQGDLTYGYCLTFEDRVPSTTAAQFHCLREGPPTPSIPQASSFAMLLKALGGTDSSGAASGSSGAPVVPTIPVYRARKALCLLSRWPFAEFFKRYLYDMYMACCGGPAEDLVSPEPRLAFLLNHLVVPVPGSRLDITTFPELAFPVLSLLRPPTVGLPVSEISFTSLMRCLAPAHIVHAMLLLMFEQKIVVHCHQPAVAGDVTLALRSLMFPLRWELFFIPLVPVTMLGFLDAPTPFLVGMPTASIPARLPDDVFTIDLDRGRVTIGHHTLAAMPVHLPSKLLQRFERRCMLAARAADIEPGSGPAPKSALGRAWASQDTGHGDRLRDMLREAWLRVMVSLLDGYRKYLRSPVEQLNLITKDSEAAAAPPEAVNPPSAPDATRDGHRPSASGTGGSSGGTDTPTDAPGSTPSVPAGTGADATPQAGTGGGDNDDRPSSPVVEAAAAGAGGGPPRGGRASVSSTMSADMSWFNTSGFVSSRKRFMAFRERLTDTQCWQSFVEGCCTAGHDSHSLVFFDACLAIVHRWPGKFGDGPDHHSLVDVGMRGPAAVALQTGTCMCGRRLRRRHGDERYVCACGHSVPAVQPHQAPPVEAMTFDAADYAPPSPSGTSVSTAVTPSTPAAGGGSSPRLLTMKDQRHLRAWPHLDPTLLRPLPPSSPRRKAVRASLARALSPGALLPTPPLGSLTPVPAFSFATRVPAEMWRDRFDRETSKAFGSWYTRDVFSSWMLLAPASVACVPQPHAQVQAVMRVLEAIAKAGHGPDEATIRCALCSVLACVEVLPADLGVVSRIISARDIVPNPLTHAMLCMAVAHAGRRRSMFSPIQAPRQLPDYAAEQDDDDVSSAGSAGHTLPRHPSISSAIAGTPPVSSAASVSTEASDTLGRHRSVSEVLRLPPSDILAMSLPPLASMAPSAGHHTRTRSNPEVSADDPPTPTAKSRWKNASAAITATNQLLAAVRRGAPVPRARTASGDEGFVPPSSAFTASVRLTDDDSSSMDSLSDTPHSPESTASRRLAAERFLDRHPPPSDLFTPSALHRGVSGELADESPGEGPGGVAPDDATAPLAATVESSLLAEAEGGGKEAAEDERGEAAAGEGPVAAAADDGAASKEEEEEGGEEEKDGSKVEGGADEEVDKAEDGEEKDGAKAEVEQEADGSKVEEEEQADAGREEPPLATPAAKYTPAVSPLTMGDADRVEDPPKLVGGELLRRPTQTSPITVEPPLSVAGFEVPSGGSSPGVPPPSPLAVEAAAGDPADGPPASALGLGLGFWPYGPVMVFPELESLPPGGVQPQPPPSPPPLPGPPDEPPPPPTPPPSPKFVLAPIPPAMAAQIFADTVARTRPESPSARRIRKQARARAKARASGNESPQAAPNEWDETPGTLSAPPSPPQSPKANPEKDPPEPTDVPFRPASKSVGNVFEFVDLPAPPLALVEEPTLVGMPPDTEDDGRDEDDASDKSVPPSSPRPSPSVVSGESMPKVPSVLSLGLQRRPSVATGGDCNAPGCRFGHSEAKHQHPAAMAIWCRNWCSKCAAAAADGGSSVAPASALLDEQVMMGWAASPEAATTFCPQCRSHFTPKLHYRVWMQSGDIHSAECAYLSPVSLRWHTERVLVAAALDNHAVALSLSSLLESSPAVYWNLQFYSARLGLPTVVLPLSPDHPEPVVPEVAIAWTEEGALDAVAPLLPSWLPRDNPAVAASLIAPPEGLSLLSIVNINDDVIQRMKTALYASDFVKATNVFLRARLVTASHPLYSRSVYTVSLVLAVNLSLFGYSELHAAAHWDVPTASTPLLTAGTGALEKGIMQALMEAGSSEELDTVVTPLDWPPVQEALSFREMLGFVFK